MDRKERVELFNSPNRFGTLSTRDGNRSLANMRKNPKTVFLFFEPVPGPFS